MPTHRSLDPSSRTATGGEENTPPAQLTAKETQILVWCSKGKTSWEIARIQNCSESTINFHFSNIRRKFAVSSRSAALIKAMESGALSVGNSVVRGADEPV
ncbi:helix-turn-helix domain-containing protein [Pseudomonas sp. GB2N2]